MHTTAPTSVTCCTAPATTSAPHDLVAPTPAPPCTTASTIVYKRGRLLQLDVNGMQRFVWTTAPTVARPLGELGYSTAGLHLGVASRRLPLDATDIALRTPKRITVVA